MSGHGMAGHIGLGKQSAFGTAVAATTYLTAMSESITESIDRFEKENIYGGLHEPADVDGVRRVAGDVVFSAYPETLGYFLNMALGRVAVSSLATALAASSFKPRTSDVSSMHPFDLYTLEVFRDVGSSQQYADIQCSQLQIEMAPNQAVRCTASLIGRATTNISPTTPTFASSSANPFHHNSASLAVGGSAVDLIEGLTITIKNNLSGRPSLNNSNRVARIKRDGPVEIRVAGNIGFENITEYEAFRQQTVRSLKANFFLASSFSFLIDIPQMVYTSFPLGIGGREYQLIGFEGRANYLASSATAIETTLTTVSSEW